MTIKEKAMKAQKCELQVTVVTNEGEKYTGWITHRKDDSFAWEHPDGRAYAFKNKDVADIRFLGEEREEEKSEGPGDTDLIYAFSPDDVPETVFEFSDKCKHADSCNQTQPKKHDIAKERWKSVKWQRDDGDCELVVSDDTMIKARQVQAISAEMTIMAAAPELADVLRTMVYDQYSTSDSIMKKAIHLLRKLGVPNVAPWYELSPAAKKE